MLTTYFKRPTKHTAYYSGPAGPYLDEFSDWLAQRGYQHKTVRHRLHGAVQFGSWVQATGGNLQSLSADALEAYRHHLSACGQLHIPAGPLSVNWLGAQLFFEFLHAQQRVAPATAAPLAVQSQWLQAFERWMQTHRGVKLSTLLNYRHHLIELLTTFGDNPKQFEAAQLRTFILAYAQHHHIASVKTRLRAIRAFLRFVIATGHCDPALEAAIPAIAQWPLSRLPRYLSAGEVARVIDSCNCSTPIGIRDRAILLLLARLGLRAGEVAHLKHQAIDWSQATFTVIGKSRREAKLPLPQEVGDALLHYLESARPPLNSDFIFITAIAPWTPLAANSITCVAAQALRRAGVEAATFGAHVLRHSAATAWLRQGASLQLIGEVLRHRCVESTAHYAKVDVQLLQQIATPWPEVSSC